jgi:hypothetical protein
MAQGDRLRAKRRLAGLPVCYGHHGIDLGDGTVVHARPDDMTRLFGGGRVVRTSLAEFAAGEAVEIVSDPPAVFPPAEIVARAVRHVGREGYCPVIDNCEHFATWCATGERRSRQVDAVVAGIGRVAAAVAAVVVARSAAGGLLARLAGSQRA